MGALSCNTAMCFSVLGSEGMLRMRGRWFGGVSMRDFFGQMLLLHLVLQYMRNRGNDF